MREKKPINASLTISRNSSDEITMRIQDKASRAEFVELRMTPHDFAMAITGLSGIDVDCVVSRLDVVGKRKIIEQRKAECPLRSYEKGDMVAWLIANCEEEGWQIDAYLGSQNSVSRDGDKTILRYTVYRYED